MRKATGFGEEVASSLVRLFLVGISLRCHDFVSSVLTAWDSHQHLHITKAYMSNTAVIELYETIPFLFPCQTTR
jgi:hypothetical protein